MQPLTQQKKARATPHYESRWCILLNWPMTMRLSCQSACRHVREPHKTERSRSFSRRYFSDKPSNLPSKLREIVNFSRLSPAVRHPRPWSRNRVLAQRCVQSSRDEMPSDRETAAGIEHSRVKFDGRTVRGRKPIFPDHICCSLPDTVVLPAMCCAATPPRTDLLEAWSCGLSAGQLDGHVR